MSEPRQNETGPGEADELLRRLRGRRAQARLAILFEALWPALWPPLGVVGLFVCAALLGVPQSLPGSLHAALLIITALLTLVLLLRGLRGLVAPGQAEADRRLERASGLPHRPLSVLADKPAEPDPIAQALWRVHVTRTLAQVRGLKVGLPRPGLARIDRRALRGGLAVALVAAFAIAGSDAPARLAQALQPNLPIAPAAQAAQLQVWATPPAYTSEPPVFFKADGGAVSLPAGSHLTASLTGGEGETPVLAIDGHTEPFRALDGASYQADLDLTAGGRLSVRRNGRILGAWDLAVLTNRAPAIAWAEPPGQAARSLQTRLPWEVSDEYGVVQLEAELRLKDRPTAPALVVSIPVPGGSTKSAKGASLQDLTAHVWAGLPVIARLIGHNAAGLVGRSDEAGFVLPERHFQHPLARALIGTRKLLSISPEERAGAVAELDRLLQQPDMAGGDYGAYLALADIYYRLVRDRAPQAVGEAQQMMWELALHLEEGGTERTARALQAAREAVRQALDRATEHPNEANLSDLDQKLKELENAIREHMQAMLEQAQREGNETPYNPDARHLDSHDLDRLAEAAREAARQGRMDEAQQKMAELERMLDQLRNARAEHGRDGRQNAEQRQRGRQQMGALEDMIARQGSLLDHAQQRAGQPSDPRAGTRPGERGAQPGQAQRGGKQPGAQPGAQSGQADSSDADRRVQQALRRALGELMQQFGDLAGQVPQSLGEADQAMQEAGEALGQSQDESAGQAEQRAIEALQKGGREMGQQMARQFGSNPSSGEGDDEGEFGGLTGMTLQGGHSDRDGGFAGSLPGQRSRGDKRDPLGRQLGQGTAGSDESDSVRVPEEMERQRTRVIQDELRRRGADRGRSQPELDYIDRLLKQF
ncbi:MAG: TIGR02302 family protein [Alphaproteobacteria bacterium]|nr:TIGR02302 family protein [Alphaproteobacteria bacterium]